MEELEASRRTFVLSYRYPNSHTISVQPALKGHIAYLSDNYHKWIHLIHLLFRVHHDSNVIFKATVIVGNDLTVKTDGSKSLQILKRNTFPLHIK